MRHFLILSLNNDPTGVLGTAHAGGQTKYVLELTKNLLFHGHSVEIFTIGKVSQPTREEFVPGAYVTRFLRPSGVPYDYDITEDEIENISSEILHYTKHTKIQVDTIVCCYWIGSTAATRLKSYLGCPLVVTFCSLAALKKKGTQSQSGNLAARFRKECELGMQADAVIAASPAEKNVLVSDYTLPEEKIHIIPCGVDLTTFHP